MKKILALGLALSLVLSMSLPVLAQESPSTKEEVIYGVLELDGSVRSLQVVNIFQDLSILDYGTYSNVQNMTTSDPIGQQADRIQIQTNKRPFYYQGTPKENDLPWNIRFSYRLDEKAITAEQLGGQSGRLEISCSVNKNPAVNPYFFENFALQIAITLDSKCSQNILAEGATIAEAGGKKQLTYTVLPGKGTNFTITADVQDFAMSSISVNGIRLELGFELDASLFTGELAELKEAIQKLDGGAADLLNGVDDLSSGMQKYLAGQKKYITGLDQLLDGLNQLQAGSKSLKDGLNELSRQGAALNTASQIIQQSVFDTTNAQLAQLPLGLPVLTPDNYSAILSQIPDLATVKAQLDGIVQFTQGLSRYIAGVDAAGAGASNLANGLSAFQTQSGLLVSSADQLYKAGSEINQGIKKLRDGLAEYRDGISQLAQGTSKMDQTIETKVDELLEDLLGTGGKVPSFVSEKNTKVSSVQFSLRTDSIDLPPVQKPTAAESAPQNFWQKLVALFRK